MAWNKQEQQTTESDMFSDENIKAWLFGNKEKSNSFICCAIYGNDGTAKSGIAMDCRSKEEIAEGKKIIIIDLDGGCGPLKVIYHDNDPNILIFNPIMRTKGLIDYDDTFLKLKATLDYIERNINEIKLKTIVFDGLDKFLKQCEYKLRKDLNKEVTDGFNQMLWANRSKNYHDVLEQIKLMDIDRYFITHEKKDEFGEPIPDWEKKTPDMMFQRIRCIKVITNKNGSKVIQTKAIIEKCKNNLSLEGKEFITSETIQKSDGTSEAKWFGLILSNDNTIKSKYG